MRLEVVATPDPAHAGLADPLGHRHGAATPMRVSFGLGLQGGVNYGLDSSHIVTGFPASPGSNLPKCLGPAISVLPAATARIMRQRSATCCGVPKATNQRWSSLRWSIDNTRGPMARGMTDYGSVRQDLSSYLWDTTLASSFH